MVVYCSGIDCDDTGGGLRWRYHYHVDADNYDAGNNYPASKYSGNQHAWNNYNYNTDAGNLDIGNYPNYCNYPDYSTTHYRDSNYSTGNTRRSCGQNNLFCVSPDRSGRRSQVSVKS
jgi:hypothetical protein